MGGPLKCVELDDASIDAAAEIAAAAFGEGSAKFAKLQIEAIRSSPRGQVVGLFTEGILVAVYGLSNGPHESELTFLAVARGRRGLGHGRACLIDAIERSNGRTLVVETDDEAVDFYRACGFHCDEAWTSLYGRLRYRLRSGFNDTSTLPGD
jgi:ribosomal protein S18 acetylase RimI-like enzyme